MGGAVTPYDVMRLARLQAAVTPYDALRIGPSPARTPVPPPFAPLLPPPPYPPLSVVARPCAAAHGANIRARHRGVRSGGHQPRTRTLGRDAGGRRLTLTLTLTLAMGRDAGSHRLTLTLTLTLALGLAADGRRLTLTLTITLALILLAGDVWVRLLAMGLPSHRASSAASSDLSMAARRVLCVLWWWWWRGGGQGDASVWGPGERDCRTGLGRARGRGRVVGV